MERCSHGMKRGNNLLLCCYYSESSASKHNIYPAFAAMLSCNDTSREEAVNSVPDVLPLKQKPDAPE